MMSQEAEQKLKSRKAIVLDHQNPTTKNQIKALAAAESTPWRTFKQKKEPPFKKRKAEPPPGGPAKSVYKSAVATTTPSKARTMDSPLSSSREQSGAPASPFGSGNLMKGPAGIQDSIQTQATNMTASSEKEIPGRVMSNTVRDKPKHTGNMAPKAADLRSLVISLLMEHHSKGMSLKGLEKAIGDAMPNSVREIEPILKQIAIFQAPGRYFLKPVVEMESFKKPSSDSGSSPELNRHPSSVHEKGARLPAPEPSVSLRTDTDELEENARLNSMPGHELDTVEKIDILHSSPNALSDKKVSDNSAGHAASSSDSGSDSDSESDSSDSGSDSGSHSRSKSRSPVASRSGSSSDSESDASSNSKQASDEDVDIMTSDDDDDVVKSKHRSQDSEPVSPKSPIPGRPPYSEPADIVDDHVSDVVEIEKDSPEDDHEAEMATATNSVSFKDIEKPMEGTKPSSPNHHGRSKSQVYGQRFYGETGNVVRDGFKQQQSDSTERMPKGKFKRHSDDKHSDERPYNNKRSKGSNSSQTVSGTMNALFGESPCNSSPGKPVQGHNKDPNIQMANRTTWDGADDSSIQKGFEQAIPSISVSESQQPDRRSFDASGQAKVPSGEERSGKHAENLGRGNKYSERSLPTSKGLKLQKDKSKREAQGEDGFVGEKRPTNFSAGVEDKQSLPTESRHRKNETVGKIKEPGFVGHSPKDSNTNFTDRSPLMNDRGRILRREHSDLELGEFREPFPDETPGSKKRFERENSFKKSENKPTSSEYWNSDTSKGKPSNKITSDSRKLSSPNPNIVASGFPDGLSKSKTPEHYADDLTRSHQRTVQSQPQQHQSRADHSEVGSQCNKFVDISKHRDIEGGANPGTSLEAHRDTYSRVPVNAPVEQRDPKPVPPYMKEGKKQKSNALANSNDKRKDASLTGSNDGGQKRRESSSDENSCLYSKYEKDKPELKGPIKDSSQYKEYVQEFQEKYESYCSLNKFLESYRDEFNNLGKDL
ncbi:dentin sialophosphoprotein-related [Abeliophyllum distichum]|uniref:Dentin sialophosphoprotein-related n=1 Tax=Abeliophyllum distichum TaxID=126358 RepID=A0ABD1RXL6_9LAMI